MVWFVLFAGGERFQCVFSIVVWSGAVWSNALLARGLKRWCLVEGVLC